MGELRRVRSVLVMSEHAMTHAPIRCQRRPAQLGPARAGSSGIACPAPGIALGAGLPSLRTQRSGRDPADAPPTVHAALRSPGRRLSEPERLLAQAILGHGFASVRIHDDGLAADSAAAVAAAAYTVGRDVVLGRGQYAPGSPRGTRLLLHELSHVVQQGERPHLDSDRVRMVQDRGLELGADRPAHGMAGNWHRSQGQSVLQRRLVVDNPTGAPAGAPSGVTNQTIIKDYVSKLCSGFTVTSGVVKPTGAAVCANVASSSTPESCGCLCSMHRLVDATTRSPVTWTISVDDADWPHTVKATRTVTVHSPFSGVQFGAWAKGPPPHRMTEENWLVLGHELCGHARLFARGTHPPGPPPTHGGRPSHDATVQIENKLATEHGVPASDLRGLFADPHHGESFARVTIAEFASASTDLATLPAAGKRNVDIAEAFMKSAAVSADVLGHTDRSMPTTSASTKRIFSELRANKVKAELVRRGVPAGRFVAVRGMGHVDCSPTSSPAACRKVEVFMFIMAGGSVTHP